MGESMAQDWIMGLIGGVMIGSAGALYLIAQGRIMGASSIIGGLLSRAEAARRGERLAFLAGLALVPMGLVWLTGPQPTNLTAEAPLLVAAGLLVGFGTRLANGCTSGHGVCGISRLSPRGIGASVLYILAGALAMALFRHVLEVI